jgi:hypothetical protein
MSIQVQCGHCGKPLEVDDKYAGTIETCNGCGKSVGIPNPKLTISPRISPFAFLPRIGPFAFVGLGAVVAPIVGFIAIMFSMLFEPPQQNSGEFGMAMLVFAVFFAPAHGAVAGLIVGAVLRAKANDGSILRAKDNDWPILRLGMAALAPAVVAQFLIHGSWPILAEENSNTGDPISGLLQGILFFGTPVALTLAGLMGIYVSLLLKRLLLKP